MNIECAGEKKTNNKDIEREKKKFFLFTLVNEKEKENISSYTNRAHTVISGYLRVTWSSQE